MGKPTGSRFGNGYDDELGKASSATRAAVMGWRAAPFLFLKPISVRCTDRGLM
ncbi:hypothetical protein [Fimbriiglobus ruber]|uniref:Uncharacterized protein n=1 Tax=Fimbriiglobus ruber TaxID=1908690 RepID=A0A225DEM4_9BACT|nr:hypothetical protein [Fimbriiglobus ruber]OWK34567.1 hypothetical protein FRUB_10538 [Fimbriiglobus ruber]